MSETAKSSLRPKNLEIMEKNYKIVSVKIPTIEKYGGGSARCMMAELF